MELVNKRRECLGKILMLAILREEKLILV